MIKIWWGKPTNINPHEYKNVLEMVRLRAIGQSFRAIARAMNQKKITTRLGKKWTHEIIKRICEREKAK
ncbi:MAG: recombinase family protein [Bdellovibrionales bacterium]|nr:recombinase family protein [Bdellovibrionales bacterium]